MKRTLLLMAWILGAGSWVRAVDHNNIDASRPLSFDDAEAIAYRERAVESGGLRAFYRIWTLREALAKACGIGFPMLADGRDYFPEAPNSGNWQGVIDGRRWLFSTGDLPGDYAVAVAIALRSPLHADWVADLTPRLFD